MECVLAHQVRLLHKLVLVVRAPSDASPLRLSSVDNALAQLAKRSFHTSQDVKLGNRDASPTNDWRMESVYAHQDKLRLNGSQDAIQQAQPASPDKPSQEASAHAHQVS